MLRFQNWNTNLIREMIGSLVGGQGEGRFGTFYGVVTVVTVVVSLDTILGSQHRLEMISSLVALILSLFRFRCFGGFRGDSWHVERWP